MEVSPTLTNQTASQPALETPKPALSSDFETFLKMLTAQMKNQDPLNPIDSADYAVQLATFSSVEQQVQTNDLLKGLAGQMGLMSMAQLAGWVGMEARTDGPVYFDGQPITLLPKSTAGADQAFLVVRDAAGDIVQRGEIPLGSDPVEWAGVTDQGAPFAAGRYGFSLETMSNGETIETTSVGAYSRISEALNDDGQITLVMTGGIKVPSASVTGLRAPNS